ncbi:hypothetical protein R6Z07F_020344 [Ovis aries]|uniref:Uncharacterized protein n=1 Tax=Ovis aries TaxID=9940 RepID=A0A836CQM5_SHEEP|nr:hypothetical protein JEQ12_020365 [Ovis aries]
MRRRQARSKKVISVRVSPLQKAPYEPRVVAERDSRTATPNRAAVAAIGLLWPGIQRPEPGASRWFSGQKDARGGNQHGSLLLISACWRTFVATAAHLMEGFCHRSREVIWFGTYRKPP